MALRTGRLRALARAAAVAGAVAVSVSARAHGEYVRDLRGLEPCLSPAAVRVALDERGGRDGADAGLAAALIEAGGRTLSASSVPAVVRDDCGGAELAVALSVVARPLDMGPGAGPTYLAVAADLIGRDPTAAPDAVAPDDGVRVQVSASRVLVLDDPAAARAEVDAAARAVGGAVLRDLAAAWWSDGLPEEATRGEVRRDAGPGLAAPLAGLAATALAALGAGAAARRLRARRGGAPPTPRGARK